VSAKPVRERAQIRLRLKARGPEIKQAILTRLYGIADPGDIDPAYLDGLRAAVSAAVEYGLEGIEPGQDSPPPVPLALLNQARLAARSGVSLETVLRRYVAGHSVLNDLLLEESAGALDEVEQKRILRKQASLLDHLIAAVSEEYARARDTRPETPERRRAEQVRRLLDGELVETSPLPYDFAACHLGVVAVGRGALEALRTAAAELERTLLAVRPEPRVLWAWLGGRRELDPLALRSHLATPAPNLAFGFGEPAQGLEGWRFTHRQAKAALAVALRGPGAIARYGEVALLAAILRDELLAASLRQLYLAPLQAERDGGEALRQSLRAYLSAECNVSSAAASLGVNRNTLASRLRTVEERLGRPLGACLAELEAALWLEGLGELEERSGTDRTQQQLAEFPATR
jgi:PucR-like helix-turn-helix protein/diguanylate cyclase with GGDEF domain